MNSNIENIDKPIENNEINHNTNRISSESVNITDSVENIESNLANLVYESNYNENIGNSMNEYLNSNQLEENSKNIYEKILNKLQVKRDVFYNDANPLNKEKEKFSEESGSEENQEEDKEIDLEKFYENRQSQYEEALLRKSFTSKPNITTKIINNSSSKIHNIPTNANEKIENLSSNKSIGNLSKIKKYDKHNENLQNTKQKNKIDNLSHIQNKSTNKSTISTKRDNYNSNNPNIDTSLTTPRNSSRQMPKTINITSYDDYKSKSVTKKKPRDVSLNISIRKCSVEDHPITKSIKRTYSDRLLSLNKSVKTNKKIQNEEKFVNLKIVNNSLEEVFDFEKIGNISVSMIKKNKNYEEKNNNNTYKINDSSYKNIYCRRKTFENSLNSFTSKPQQSKNPTELSVNLFRSMKKSSNITGKDEKIGKEMNGIKINDDNVIKTNAPIITLKADIRKTPPVAVTIINKEEKEPNNYFNEKILKNNSNDVLLITNENSYNNIKETENKNHLTGNSENRGNDFKIDKKRDKDNHINNLNDKLAISNEIRAKNVNMYLHNKQSNTEKIQQNKELNRLKSQNKTQTEIVTDLNPGIKHEKNNSDCNKSMLKPSISLNVNEPSNYYHESSMQIYIKPKLSNRMNLNRSYSSAKNRSVKINHSKNLNNFNNFEDFYKKNINWKKSIEDDLKVLKEQKQLDELKDCSFTPKVLNSTTRTVNKKKDSGTIIPNPEEFYLKNLKWKSKIEKFKQDEFVEKERKEFAECIFRPNYKKLNNKFESSKKSSPIKIRADDMYKKSLKWLNKINENKKIKQLEIQQELKEKSKHVTIYDRINRSRSKSQGKMKQNTKSMNGLQDNSINEVELTHRLDTEGQKLKEDLSSINVRSNYFSSMSNRSNNFFALYKELERNTIDKDMKELKELIVSLKATLEENKKVIEENVPNKSITNPYNNDMNININQSYNITINDVNSGNNKASIDENMKLKRNYSVDKVSYLY